MGSSEPSDSVAPIEEPVCPHLGIEEDPQTCLGYPSYWNYCHHANPISAIRMSQQRKMCLCSTYPDCPVFKSEQTGPLPLQLRGRSKGPR